MLRPGLLFALYFFSLIASAKDLDVVPGEFLVKLKPAAFRADSDNLEKAFNAKVVEKVNNESRLVLIKRAKTQNIQSVISELQQNEQVEYAEPNFIFHATATPNDPEYSRLWGMNNTGQPDEAAPTDKTKTGYPGFDIGAEKAWDITTGSSSIVIGIIDTGIDINNPELADNIWVNEKELNGKTGVDDDGNGYIDDIHGYNFAEDKPEGLDNNGHGSHCAGTIGGTGNNGAGIVGVNWKIKMVPIKFLDASGGGTLVNAVKAVDYATKLGVNLTSNSWSGGNFTQALKDAIERAQAAGQLFVAAAGNTAANNDVNPGFPASYDLDNILSVAAVNNRGEMATFSCWGQKSVDIAAPGVNVLSTVLKGALQLYSGTSMAAPHVAGVAALVLSNEPKLSYLELKERLMNTSKKYAGLKLKTVSGGLVNAYHALTNTIPPQDPNDPGGWNQESVSLSTPHPYLKNTVQSFDIVKPGAKRIAVLFNSFDLERDIAGTFYDKVEFIDAAGTVVGAWVGEHAGAYSPIVEGEKMTVRFTSDSSIEKYGFESTTIGVLY
jgi:thermitase